MLNRVCLAAAILAVAATPAFADNDCGTGPIPPVIPAASELAAQPVEAARAELITVYKQVKNYQGALKPFYVCLMSQTEADKAALAEAKSKGDKSKIASIQQNMADIDKVSSEAEAAETQLANDFNALHIAHCTRDTDPKVCKK